MLKGGGTDQSVCGSRLESGLLALRYDPSPAGRHRSIDG